MVNDIVKSLQGDLDKAIEAFKRELAQGPHRARQPRASSTACASTTTARRRR